MKKSLKALLALLLPSYVLFALPTVVSAQNDEIPAVSSNHCGAFVEEYVFEDADVRLSLIIRPIFLLSMESRLFQKLKNSP